MRKKVLFGLLFLVVFMPRVFAAGYYRDASGLYFLCPDNGDCFSITQGEAGASFDLKNKIIQYQDVDYYFDVGRQTDYDLNHEKETTMYYYMKNNQYVLCNSSNDCKTYTFEELEKFGVTIIYQNSITFPASSPGDTQSVYRYQASKDSSVPIQKPVYEAKTDYCTRLKEPLQFLGRVVLIVKILIPIVIIAFGMLDFFKAVTGAKDDEIKKSARSFAFRCASGVIIFFIPTLVSLIFSLVSDFANIKGDFNACQKCIFRVTECK